MALNPESELTKLLADLDSYCDPQDSLRRAELWQNFFSCGSVGPRAIFGIPIIPKCAIRISVIGNWCSLHDDRLTHGVREGLVGRTEVGAL